MMKNFKTITFGRYRIYTFSHCWAESKEKKNFVNGSVRVIGNVLMFGYVYERHSFSHTVRWVPTEKTLRENSDKQSDWIGGL